MAKIILTSNYEPPIQEFDATPRPCFVARGVDWLRSFVAINGTRSICEMEAPYAEIVRDACRQDGLTYDQIWRAEVCFEQGLSTLPSNASLVIAEVINDASLTLDRWRVVQEQIHPYLQAHDIQPIHTLISRDGRNAVSTFATASIDTVQQAYDNLGVCITLIWRSRLVLPSPVLKELTR
jgi:hypothetical protein